LTWVGAARIIVHGGTGAQMRFRVEGAADLVPNTTMAV
jgi:hypothetical protein